MYIFIVSISQVYIISCLIIKSVEFLIYSQKYINIYISVYILRKGSPPLFHPYYFPHGCLASVVGPVARTQQSHSKNISYKRRFHWANFYTESWQSSGQSVTWSSRLLPTLLLYNIIVFISLCLRYLNPEGYWIKKNL